MTILSRSPEYSRSFPWIVQPGKREDPDTHQHFPAKPIHSHILPYIAHFCTSKIPGGKNHPAVHARHLVSLRTYATSGGSSPIFGFSLLCTTNIANSVRLASRSDSASPCSSFSTSFRSSERAYLRVDLRTLVEKNYSSVQCVLDSLESFPCIVDFILRFELDCISDNTT